MRFFVDFFDGNISYPISFWVFGIFGIIIIGVSCALLNLPYLLIAIISSVYFFASSVGIINSMERYDGPVIWTILGRIYIAVCFWCMYITGRPDRW